MNLSPCFLALHGQFREATVSCCFNKRVPSGPAGKRNATGFRKCPNGPEKCWWCRTVRIITRNLRQRSSKSIFRRVGILTRTIAVGRKNSGILCSGRLPPVYKRD